MFSLDFLTSVSRPPFTRRTGSCRRAWRASARRVGADLSASKRRACDFGFEKLVFESATECTRIASLVWKAPVTCSGILCVKSRKGPKSRDLNTTPWVASWRRQIVNIVWDPRGQATARFCPTSTTRCSARRATTRRESTAGGRESRPRHRRDRLSSLSLSLSRPGGEPRWEKEEKMKKTRGKGEKEGKK